MSDTPPLDGITEQVTELRAGILEIAKKFDQLDFTIGGYINPSANLGEMKANLKLAYRHLEDAQNRLELILTAKNA